MKTDIDVEKFSKITKDISFESVSVDDLLTQLSNIKKKIEIERTVDKFNSAKEIIKKKKQLEISNLEKYIDGCLTLESQDQQKFKKRDSQYDNICMYLNLSIDETSILVDFGSGPYLNLFKQVSIYQNNGEFSNKLIYFAYDTEIKIDEIKIEPKEFNELIALYANSKKDLNNVFFLNFNLLYTHLYDNYQKLADYLIVKNVNHEICLSKLPEFINEIYQLTNKNSIMIFYDLENIAEPFNHPWDSDMYYDIFDKFLNCTVTFHPYPEANQRQPLHMCKIKKGKNKIYRIDELRGILFKMFGNRVDRLLDEKRKIVYGDRSFEQLTSVERRLKYLKLINYHSHIEQQIREAKEEWGIK
ncbi:MAG: hypothetical protein GQ534_12560 [Candidatus Delongbacteria bacterium]|nr:hypothetical protein [Candidatus Delongbacteria bacterium]